MTLFRIAQEDLVPVISTFFATALVKKRQNLQRLLRRRRTVLGDDLLFITEECGAFERSQRRINLLAVDRTGRSNAAARGPHRPPSAASGVTEDAPAVSHGR